MSKTIIRVATKDQYCYVEKEVSLEGLTPKEYAETIKDEYQFLFSELNGYGDCNFLDDLLIIVKNNLRIEGESSLEHYEGFTDKQKLVLKEIKNLVSRAISKYKPEK